jgi:hypothetical protein
MSVGRYRPGLLDEAIQAIAVRYGEHGRLEDVI